MLLLRVTRGCFSDRTSGRLALHAYQMSTDSPTIHCINGPVCFHMGWDGMGCGVSQLFVSESKVVIVLPSHLSAHGADGAPC